MMVGWKAKTSIYDLVKSLAWKSSQEMTDEIWGRLAWVVRIIIVILPLPAADYSMQQMKLVDYSSTAPANKGGKDDGPWDFVDKELADQREKALTIPVAARAAYSSLYVCIFVLVCQRIDDQAASSKSR
jgi:hypothetical protein